MTLFINSKVSCDSTVSSFSLHNSITINANRGHETERAEALRNDIRHHITIVVLASPNEATVRLDSEGDEIIDQSVLIPEFVLFELRLVFVVVELLEDVLEAAIILL